MPKAAAGARSGNRMQRVKTAFRSLTLATVMMGGVSGCSKEDKAVPIEPPPRPAQSAPGNAQTTKVSYRIAPQGQALVKLKARDATPTGVMSVVRGQLDVDIGALDNSTGYVEVDLGSLRMFADDGEAIDPLRTEEARNWLEVGSDRPPTEKEGQRWARFEVKTIDRVSQSRPDQGKPVAPAAPSASAGPARGSASAIPSGSAAAPTVPPPKGYEVTMKATGYLTVHSVRVERTVSLSARFFYAGDADPTDPPIRIELETARPVLIGLKSHDIKPRDGKGVFIAAGMKLLGKQVGRDAAVTLKLHGDRVKSP